MPDIDVSLHVGEADTRRSIIREGTGARSEGMAGPCRPTSGEPIARVNGLVRDIVADGLPALYREVR